MRRTTALVAAAVLSLLPPVRCWTTVPTVGGPQQPRLRFRRTSRSADVLLAAGRGVGEDDGALSHPTVLSRRAVLSAVPTASAFLAPSVGADAVDLDFFTQSGRKQLDPRATVDVRVLSSSDRLGLRLADTTLRRQPVVYIAASARDRLQPGLLLLGYESAADVVQRIRTGPWPVDLTFFNLAAAGDAFNDAGQTMVTPMDALQLAKRTDDTGDPVSPSTSSVRITADPNQNQQRPNDVTAMTNTPAGDASNHSDNVAYTIVTQDRPSDADCVIQTRRGDLLEIDYEARVLTDSGRQRTVVYDSSATRGTGQPYQMVLGSGDMIPGVDQGLYDMCPGEVRTITIPPQLAYGPKGNRLFRIPPNVPLQWRIRLVSIDGIVRQDNNNRVSREEREQRALY